MESCLLKKKTPIKTFAIVDGKKIDITNAKIEKVAVFTSKSGSEFKTQKECEVEDFIYDLLGELSLPSGSSSVSVSDLKKLFSKGKIALVRKGKAGNKALKDKTKSEVIPEISIPDSIDEILDFIYSRCSIEQSDKHRLRLWKNRKVDKFYEDDVLSHALEGKRDELIAAFAKLKK